MMPPACGACGAKVPSGSKFCNQCGARVAGEGPSRDLRSYTPKHLADRILTARSALEGERKQVTILFADVKGSMELADEETGALCFELFVRRERAELARLRA